MAIPQADGTIVYKEHFRREIEMNTAQYTGAECAIGAWPQTPAGDSTMEFVNWCQPYSGSTAPSQWLPMAPADDYSIYYDPNNQTQEYLISTALMKALDWDGGTLSGYSRVYWRIPTLIKHHTGYTEYEWTTWKFFYVRTGNSIITPNETPGSVVDYEGVTNIFKRWQDHIAKADGTDININAVYERDAIRYTIRYYGKYYDSHGVNTYTPSTRLLLTCHAFGGANIDILPTADPQNWEFHYNRQNIPVASHFWGVINDGTGAPLYSTWDGTCLYRDMDLCAELWLTGPEGSDFVPEGTIQLSTWPDGDDIHHGEGEDVEPGYGRVKYIDTDGTLIYEYKKKLGSYISLVSSSRMQAYCTSVGKDYENFDYWSGLPSDRILRVAHLVVTAVWKTAIPRDKVIFRFLNNTNDIAWQYVPNKGVPMNFVFNDFSDHKIYTRNIPLIDFPHISPTTNEEYTLSSSVPMNYIRKEYPYDDLYQSIELAKKHPEAYFTTALIVSNTDGTSDDTTDDNKFASTFYKTSTYLTEFSLDKIVYYKLTGFNGNIPSYCWPNGTPAISVRLFIPDENFTIESHAFTGTNFTNLFVCFDTSENNYKVPIIEEKAFEESLITSLHIGHYGPSSEPEEGHEDRDVIVIPYRCFYNSRNLRYLNIYESNASSYYTFPRGLYLEDEAFAKTSIEFVGTFNAANSTSPYDPRMSRLGAMIYHYGRRCFADCKKLRWVTLGKRTHSIDSLAFENCTSLSTILWDNDVQLTGDEFYGCNALSTIISYNYKSIKTLKCLAPIIKTGMNVYVILTKS
jgi:hypothetical protein